MFRRRGKKTCTAAAGREEEEKGLSHEPFIVFSLPSPAEEGRDQAALVGTKCPARVTPSQFYNFIAQLVCFMRVALGSELGCPDGNRSISGLCLASSLSLDWDRCDTQITKNKISLSSNLWLEHTQKGLG